MFDNNLWGKVDSITNELLSKNERTLEKWCEYNEATNGLKNEVETNGYVRVAI